jgi:hypothetical protein
MGLAANPEGPVIGIVSRMTGQKGFELMPDVLPVLLHRYDVRLVRARQRRERFERYFQWLRDSFPQKVGVYRGYHDQLSHWIEAGSDLFLMPSRYEPCGLNQMYSLRVWHRAARAPHGRARRHGRALGPGQEARARASCSSTTIPTPSCLRYTTRSTSGAIAGMGAR